MDWGPTSGLLILSPKQGLLSGPVLMPEEILPKSWRTPHDDIEMADAEVIEAEQPDGDGGSAPRRSLDPEEVPEQIPDQAEENPDKIAGEGDPQVPQDPQDDSPQPHQQVLQGFQTVAQTFSAAYGSASSDIQQVIRRSLRESTNDDRTFIYGASNAIHRWVESVRPAMAGNDTGKDGVTFIERFVHCLKSHEPMSLFLTVGRHD